ncbi:kinase-like protein, partial [Dissoconium aciculare CBS 342.82]|uniref:non-specific serine/threonine protein kinase n=1 Tax=Dissoconium aciculare CBS 342.82 TaxID=1314786 RepID=A0A6J3LX20_9PEZI
MSSDAPGTYASPYLHYTHVHVPKETHVADVEVDPVSGRKIVNHYEIIDELGRGTHGKVKLGRDLNEQDSFVAIKIVERYSKRRKLGKLATTEDKVKKEVAILKKARHPNVVALLEVIDDPTSKKVYIVLEWVEKGEITWRDDNMLRSQLDPELEYVPVMTMDKIRVAFRDTLLGLQYLHYQGIVHRDIKPPNLLTTNQGRVKISDFGVSYLGRPVHDGERGEELSEAETQDLGDEAKELAKTVGTPAFYAPELCNTDVSDEIMPVTKAIDVWALGITLFCMLFARTPYVDGEYVVMRQIADEEVYLPRKRLAPPISDELHDLMRRLLTKDPQARITLEDVRQHPWVLEDLPNKAKWLEETDPS